MHSPRRRCSRAWLVVPLAVSSVCAAWWGTASAATITVTTTADVVDPGDGVMSLREAFTLGNNTAGADVIVLGAAAYELSDCGRGALTHTDIAGLAVNGNGATIHQQCDATPVLAQTLHDSPFHLSDLHVLGGPNGAAVKVDGAGIQGTSPLILTNVKVTGAHGGSGGSAVSFDYGSAVHDVELHGVTISGNVGDGVSNISNNSGVLVTDSTIAFNSGGGLVVADGSPIDMSNSSVTDNGGYGVFTTGQGNGLQPIVTVTASEIARNGRGGLTCRSGCRSLTITGSDVSDNGAAAAAGSGGGVEFVTYQPAFTTPTVTIADSTINGNSAQHDGGGVWIHPAEATGPPDAVPVSIVDSDVSDNHADCAGCRGGGVAALVGSLTLDSTTLSGNTAAADGGAVFHSRGAADVASEDAEFHLTNSTVAGNSAGGRGGGVSTTAHVQAIDGSWVHDNTAAGAGGGVVSGAINALLDPSAVSVTNSTISGNTGSAGGGLMLLAGALVDLVNSSITDNAAANGGGVAVSLLSNLHLEHATVVRNTAAVGANVAADSPVAIARSVVARPQGGGVNCAGHLGPAWPGGTSAGYSWFDDGTCDPGPNDTVAPGADPELGPLADNGGPTPTLLPTPSSPVAGSVPVASCPQNIDQRGQPRPAGSACDAGAVEIVEAQAMIITGTPGADALFGTSADDEIHGLGGPDLLGGLAGADILEGGGGGDLLIGGPGDDVLRGGPGKDILIGGPGHDVLDGGPGHDLCIDPDQIAPSDC